MERFPITIACLDVVKKCLQILNTILKLKLSVTWRRPIKHRTTYMCFWGEAVLASISIESYDFTVKLEPWDVNTVFKISLFRLNLPGNEI
jgi:hypothetical protein